MYPTHQECQARIRRWQFIAFCLTMFYLGSASVLVYRVWQVQQQLKVIAADMERAKEK